MSNIAKNTSSLQRIEEQLQKIARSSEKISANTNVLHDVDKRTAVLLELVKIVGYKNLMASSSISDTDKELIKKAVKSNDRVLENNEDNNLQPPSVHQLESMLHD